MSDWSPVANKFDGLARLVLVSFALVIALPAQTPADSAVYDATLAEAVRTIRASRAPLEEPPELRRIHWEPFRAERAEPTCNRSVGDVAAAFGQECRDEAIKLGKALFRSYFPMIAKAGEKQPDPAKEYQTILDLLGAPGAPATCLLKGVVRVIHPEGPTREDWIARIDAADALKGLAGTPDSMLTVAEKLLSTPSTIAKAEENLKKVRGSTETTIRARFERELEAGLGAFSNCSFEEARAKAGEARETALGWALHNRQYISEAEVQTYCEAKTLAVAAGSLGMTDSPLGDDFYDSLTEANEAYRRAVGMLDTSNQLWWATDEGIELKRKYVAQYPGWIQTIEAIPDEAIAACDTAPALEKLRAIRPGNGCLAESSGAIDSEKLETARRRVLAFDTALGHYRDSFKEADRQAAESVDGCTFDGSIEVFTEALSEHDRRFGPDYTSAKLRRCWVGPWPPEAHVDRVAEARRAVLEQLEAANVELRLARYESQAADACAVSNADHHHAMALLLFQRVECAEDFADVAGWRASHEALGREIAARQGEVDRQVEDLQRAQEARSALLASMDEELAKASNPQDPQHCSAAANVEQMAALTDGMEGPSCDQQQFRAFLEEIAVRVERARDWSQQEADSVDELWSTALARLDACDPTGAQQARDELEATLPTLCEPPVIDYGQFDRRREALDRTLNEAQTVLGEARTRVAAWQESCDPSQLENLQAEFGQVPRCSHELLQPEQRAEAQELWSWGERAATMRSRADQIQQARDQLQQARIQYEASRRRAAVEPFTEIDRLAERRALEQARMEIDQGYEEILQAQSDPYVAPVCYEGLLEQINSLDADIGVLLGELGGPSENQAPGWDLSGETKTISGTVEDSDSQVDGEDDRDFRQLASRVISAMDRCDYQAAFEAAEVLRVRYPEEPWVLENQAVLSELKSLRHLDVRSAIRQAQSSLLRNDDRGWAEALAPFRRAGCQDPVLERYMNDTLAREAGRDAERGRRMAGSVEAGHGVSNRRSAVLTSGARSAAEAGVRRRDTNTDLPGFGFPAPAAGEPTVGAAGNEQSEPTCKLTDKGTKAGHHYTLWRRPNVSNEWELLAYDAKSSKPKPPALSGFKAVGYYKTHTEGVQAYERECADYKSRRAR